MVLLAQPDLGPGGLPARKEPKGRQWGNLGICWKIFSGEAPVFAFLQVYRTCTKALPALTKGN